MQKIFITTVFILAFLVGNAQTTPEPPTPPSTSSSSSSSSSSTYSSSSTSSDSNESTSISISHTEDDYKLRARFPKNRYQKLKNLIEETLGGKNMDIGSGYSKWSSDEKVYYVKLTKKSLRISLDLNVASPELAEKFENLGKDIKIIVSGSSVKVEKERMQREADRMRTEAERMKREAVRLERQYQRESERIEQQAKRELERAKREEHRKKEQLEREAKRMERDAKRIEREAKRVELEAKRLEEKARHKGGVSSYIKRLLEDPKTKYTSISSGSNLNWIWPEVQENLLTSLQKDNLIKSTSEVIFTSEKDHMYVNGAILAEAQYEKYLQMFRKAGIQSNADFSFYKKGDHIVVIGLNAKIKKVFNDLHKKGYIASTDEAVKLLIDGDKITQNGQKLTSNLVATYNAILRDNGIIPAPGKYIEMKEAGSYRLGYSLGSKGIIGTWIEEDR
ncbi:hypothetical protein [uncultured Kordia sp.]|uniref:hypothetical protein n=1 Tax=uncultured Kordia sp. TaxID=507699 RepID=UPI002630536F|nr:hypothetical protein [uncultured Kordia sp.]